MWKKLSTFEEICGRIFETSEKSIKQKIYDEIACLEHEQQVLAIVLVKI